MIICGTSSTQHDTQPVTRSEVDAIYSVLCLLADTWRDSPTAHPPMFCALMKRSMFCNFFEISFIIF